MNEMDKEDLKKAYRSKKDPKIRARILAVHIVSVCEESICKTATNLMQSERWVRDWLKRYDEGDLNGLRDLPRPGRPRAVPRVTIDRIIGEMVPSGCTQVRLQERIHAETGTKLRIIYVRKILRWRGLSPKRPQRIHINRADKRSVQSWQYRLKRIIPHLEKARFMIATQGESFFLHDMMTGRKYWSPKGQRISASYTGSHKKITMYGALARDGKQLFRAYERFNAPTFVAYLKEMQRHFGKVAVMTDRAPQHRSKLVRELIRKNKNIRIIYFPKGSPYPNVVEECWHQGKRVLLAS